MPLCDYIRMQPPRAFSEFNALGAYAWEHHRDKFVWVNTLDSLTQTPMAKQFHSWGGITLEIRTEIETILSAPVLAEPLPAKIGSGKARESTASSCASATKTEDSRGAQNTLRGTEKGCALGSGSACPQSSGPEHSVPSQTIKKLSNGVWVLEGDQISQWVEQEGRLDHDQNFLPKILRYIKEGDTVIDVGAFIGDHTIAYAHKAKKVIAFEPNPIAFECLKHNTRELGNVDIYRRGLGDKPDLVTLSGNNGNWGGAYVGEHMPVGQVVIHTLDSCALAPDLIKIDAEGYEMKVLSGAQHTISKHHPIMVIEINREALRRQNEFAENIFQWLGNYGYDWDIMQENCFVDSPMYDILCLPKAKAPAPLTPYGEMLEAVNVLKHFADGGTNDRKKVMANLRYSGLTPLRPPRRKKRREKPKTDPTPSRSHRVV
jgi:FkbM family methyltransferase